MRFNTNRVYLHGIAGYIQQTRLHLDCTHTLTYYGSPEEAEQRLRESGGTIAGLITRCKHCTALHQATVQDIINEARRSAGL